MTCHWCGRDTSDGCYVNVSLPTPIYSIVWNVTGGGIYSVPGPDIVRCCDTCWSRADEDWRVDLDWRGEL